MVTVETYIRDTIKLVRSITLKSNDVAIQMNNELIKIYGTSILGTTPEDKTQWKYYMNLCGEYHQIDNPIKLTIIETGTVKELTKELLAQYPTTHAELLKHDIYYTDLIDSYPNDELLIKGIVYGLDMDYVINAEDGSVLSYSEVYVEEQESNLISELSTYSINFFRRWHIREYGIIDDLFLPSLLATLYSKLVLKVLNIRYANIYTSNIHSFHMYEFFRSHFDIDTSILNKTTRFWLYKNMRYIRKHIGSNETLNIIIEKILTNNGIGIAEIELINSLPDIQLLDMNDITQSLYDKKTNSFISKPRNSYYLNSDADNLTGYQMLYTQFDKNLVDNDMIIKDTSDIDTKFLPKLDKNILHRQKTKTFKLKINKNHVVTQDVTMKTLLDNWVYLAFTDKYRTMKKFIDPNTGVTYNITSIQGVLMVFKLFGLISGVNNPIINGYTANNVLDEDQTFDTLLKDIARSDVMETIVNKILTRIPINHTYIGDDNFNQYITDFTVFRSLIWNIASNTTDMLMSSNMQIIYRRLHKRVYVNISEDKTIDELISDQHMYYEVTEDYDSITVIKTLFELFTGYKVGDDDIESDIAKYIDITKKLSSYTVQFISDKNDLNIIPLRYNSIESMNVGIADIRDSTFRALEDFYGFVNAVAIPYSNFLDQDQMVLPIYNNRLINPPKLIMYGINNYMLDEIEAEVEPKLIAHRDSYVRLYSPEIDSTISSNDPRLNDLDGLDYGSLMIGESGIKRVQVITTDGNYSVNPTLISNVSDKGIDLFAPNINGDNFNLTENTETLNDGSIINIADKINDAPSLVASEFGSEANIQPTMLFSPIKPMGYIEMSLFIPTGINYGSVVNETQDPIEYGSVVNNSSEEDITYGDLTPYDENLDTIN